jgi:hypothetical protein
MLRKSDEGHLLDRRVMSEISSSGAGPLTAETPPYSTDPAVAGRLVGLMESEGHRVEIEQGPNEWTCTLTSRSGVKVGLGETEALSICSAFLDRRIGGAGFV